MSVDVRSSIFNDLINRIQIASPSHVKHVISIEPITNADVLHFHRLQKCDVDEISSNSVATLHFDPLDLRQHQSISDLFTRLKLFRNVVFMNRPSFNACSFLEEKRILIPHGYDERLLLRKVKKPHSKVNIAFMCKYYKDGRKGDNYFFELLSLLPNNFRFYLVGACWPKKLEQRCESIRVIHPSSYDDIIRLYSVIDVVLITSPYEGGPACLPEALSAGCKVFSSRCGMATDILDERFLLDLNTATDKDKIMRGLQCNSTMDIEHKEIITWSEVSYQYNKLYQSII